MPHRRGNPKWASGESTRVLPWLRTAFEEQVKQLGLNEQTFATSRELQQWCQRNKDRRYIPEWLLKRWRIVIDPNVSR